MDDRLRRGLRSNLRGRLLFDEPVLRRSTLRIGGPADIWFEPLDRDDLAAFLQVCGREEIPFYLVGNGSNLLVRDGGFRGALIHLNGPEFKSVNRDGDRLQCGGGVTVSELIQIFKEEGLAGGEFLVGIPGTVGGALRMNAGAQGCEVSQIVVEVEIMTRQGRVERKKREEIDFFYRQVPEFQDKIVLSALLELRRDDRKAIRGRLQEYSRKRAEVTPPHPNAGCIFKNPDGVSAGLLIDRAGLKGLRQGEAQVSLEHGNYFVNLGNATAGDLLSLMEKVRREVQARHGVSLEPEIQIIGVEL